MSLGRSKRIEMADALFNNAYHAEGKLDLTEEIKAIGYEACGIVLQGIFANREPRERIVNEPTSAFTIAVNQAIGLAVLADQVESRDVMLKRYGIVEA